MGCTMGCTKMEVNFFISKKDFSSLYFIVVLQYKIFFYPKNGASGG